MGLRRSITHWTAGGGRASALDKEHYHKLTEFDGTYVDGKHEFEDNVVVSDGDYAAHTLRLNTGSAGFAMCGMRGATESPLDFGPSPLTEIQFERHCEMLADFHLAHGIPILPETCLTHAEVEPRLGVKQRGKWDIAVLPFKPHLRGALRVGDYMRERVRHYADEKRGYKPVLEVDYPTLKMGSTHPHVVALQKTLRSLGYFVGKVDGIFGPRTRAAVLAFQADKEIAVDGIVGPQTWGKLSVASKRPLRTVSTKDLRKRGEETVKEADAIQRNEAVKLGATAAGTAGIYAELRKVQGELEGVGGIVAEGPLGEMWPLLLAALGIGIAVFSIWNIVKAQRVKQKRTRAAQEGADLEL